MSYLQQDLTSQARGDTWNLQFNMQDVDGNVLDITGNQYWFTLKSDVSLTDAQAELQVGPIAIPAGEAAQGIVKITVSGISTNILAPATYNYDLQEVESNGTVNTLLIGKIRVKADVTRTADYSGSATVTTSSAGRALYSAETTTTSTTEIFLGGVENSRLSIEDDGILSFDALVAGRDNTTGNACAFQLFGALKKDTTTTELIGSVGKVILGEDDAAFDANITADDTNDSLKLEVTAASTNTTKWTAEVQYTQVSF